MVSIIKATSKYYSEIADILKESFPVHNLFSYSKLKIINYLKDSNSKKRFEGYFVAKENDEIIGVIKLTLQMVAVTKTHTRWKINHLAVKEKYRHNGVAVELMNYVESIINKEMKLKKFKTAKLLLEFSELNKSLLKFYKLLGYKLEGKISSKYRYNETAYIMGKEII